MPFVHFLIKCLLLPVLFATAWDVAVITKENIEFFRDEQWVGRGYGYLKDLSVGAYDPVNGYLYVSDSSHPNASIFRIDTQHANDVEPSAISFQPIISKQSSVQGIAFDPVTSTLFWTTGNGNTILKLKTPGNGTRSTLHHPGTVLHQFDDGSIPRGIAVDSCRQKLYWTNIRPTGATIEKSGTDGSQRTTIASTALSKQIKVVQPYSIIVDHHSEQLYWCDAVGGMSFQIVRSDLDGHNVVIMISESGQEPYGLTIVGDLLYWTDSHQGNLLSLPKNITPNTEPKLVKKFGQHKNPDGVISSILYLDVNPETCTALAPFIPQMKKLREHESAIISHIRNDSSPEMTENCSSEEMGQCLNGGVLKNRVCQCPKGFTGARCEQSLCHNYCISGSCDVDEHGTPMCSCTNGWTGLRCEIDRCRDACFNDGQCSINEQGKSSCKCAIGFVGRRCEFQSNVMQKLCKAYCDINKSVAKSGYPSPTAAEDFKSAIESLTEGSPFCSCKEEEQILSSATSGYAVVSDDEIDDSNKEQPLVSTISSRRNVLVIVLLAMLCVLLGGLVVFLTGKILSLRKRPRIKKRIVVNRPPAPFCRPSTATRDQCEITIENCCNMNICETPCFEPEFRLSKPTFNKRSKSEDKKILISSMHSNSSQDDENY